MREKAGKDLSQMWFWNTYVTVYPLILWPYLKIWGQSLSPRAARLSADAPLAQLPAADGGDAIVSAGAWTLHTTLPLSSFLQMFGVHFVLKLSCTQARAFQPWLAATAHNEIQMSMTYGKSTISLEYCSQWNPMLRLTAPKLLSRSFISLPQNTTSDYLCQSTFSCWTDSYMKKLLWELHPEQCSSDFWFSCLAFWAFQLVGCLVLLCARDLVEGREEKPIA